MLVLVVAFLLLSFAPFAVPDLTGRRPAESGDQIVVSFGEGHTHFMLRFMVAFLEDPVGGHVFPYLLIV